MIGYLKKVRCVDCLNLPDSVKEDLAERARAVAESGRGGALLLSGKGNVLCARENKEFSFSRLNRKERCPGYASKRFSDFYNATIGVPIDVLAKIFRFK